jgi:hypothetical protein
MRKLNHKQTNRPTTVVVAACLGAAAITSASAAIDPTFDAGDLILGVQSSAITSTVLEFNLGAPLLYKNASSSFLVGNISLQLTNVFGANWWESPELFFGVSGANNFASITPGTADANGDFNSTIYATRSRNGDLSVGLAGSTPWSMSASQVTNAASPMVAQGGRFNGNDVDGIATLATSLTNEWSDFNPVSGTAQNAAYNAVFTSGIQFRFDVGVFDSGSFAGLTNVEAVADLYRLTRFNNDGSTPGAGQYLGSFAIERDGDVHFIDVVPEPGAAVALACGLATLMGFRRARHGRI